MFGGAYLALCAVTLCITGSGVLRGKGDAKTVCKSCSELSYCRATKAYRRPRFLAAHRDRRMHINISVNSHSNRYLVSAELHSALVCLRRSPRGQTRPSRGAEILHFSILPMRSRLWTLLAFPAAS